MTETAQTESARAKISVSISELLRFEKVLSKEIAQYHHPDSIVLYCWFSAVIFNLGVINHFLKGEQ